MRLVNLYYCEEGSRLGEAILEPQTKRVLLNKGHRLTKEIIKKLIEKGFVHVKIDESYNNAVYLSSEQVEEKRKLNEEVKTRLEKLINLTTDDSLIKKVGAISHGKNSKELSGILKKLINEVVRSRNLYSMVETLQTEKDGYFFHHGLNTMIYSVAIGIQMNLKNDQLYTLGLGAFLHDIGETFLPKEILSATERTREQRAMYKRHPTLGYELIKRHSDMSLLAAHCAYQHHEHYDGSGFPRGLKGDDILLFARIVAVADTYDSLLNPHDGSQPLLPHEAYEVLNGYCYLRFDPEVITAFRQAIAIYPIGTEVTLNTGERAIVYRNNYFAPHRPTVTLITDRTGNALPIPKDINLSEKGNQTILIINSELTLDAPRPRELRGIL